MKILLVLFLSSTFIFTVQTYHIMPEKEKRYFEVLNDRFESSFEDKSVMEMQLKVRKINNTRSFVGSVEFHVPVGNDFTIEIKVLKKQGGEYRYLPYFLPPTPFCSICAKDSYCYPDIAKRSDLPEDIANNCPLEPKIYAANGVICDTKEFPQTLSSGEYSLEIIFARNGAKAGVYRFYSIINNI